MLSKILYEELSCLLLCYIFRIVKRLMIVKEGWLDA